jgi:hypothetical protein
MKIGLSYSRCIRDIVEGKVAIEDVLIVIARTDFDPHNDEQWKGIWQGYGGGSDANLLRGYFSGTNPEWAGYTDEDEDLFRSATIELWEQGKFHQPRQFGARPRRMPYYWLNTFLPDDELDQNPAAKAAFEKFQMIAGLVNAKPLKTEHE